MAEAVTTTPTVEEVRAVLRDGILPEHAPERGGFKLTAEGSCVVVTVAEATHAGQAMPVVPSLSADEAAWQLEECAAELAKHWPVVRRGDELVVGVPASRPMGTEGPLLTPGSDAWLRTISASKIAAIAGVSPWDSAFSLYWKMNGTIVEPQTDAMRRGHYLEPAIARWFADQHPDLHVYESGTWTHATLPWATASPDRLARRGPGPNYVLLEIKSTTQDHEWVDGPPPYVAAQVQWQLEVTGLDVCHVAVLGSFLEFSEHVIEYDEREAARLVEMAADFLGKLERQEHPPIDSHDATYQTERALHPLIDRETDVELPDELVRRYCQSRELSDLAKRESTEVASLILEEMLDARRGTWNGQTIVTRQARGEGLPYLVAGRSLPSFENESEAA